MRRNKFTSKNQLHELVKFEYFDVRLLKIDICDNKPCNCPISQHSNKSIEKNRTKIDVIFYKPVAEAILP
jgi:hypothetical protein